MEGEISTASYLVSLAVARSQAIASKCKKKM